MENHSRIERLLDPDMVKAVLERTKPENWHENRYLTYIPDHFIRCKMPADFNQLELLTWLEKTTHGRFAIATDVEGGGSMNFFVEKANTIAFEDPQEATLFTLSFR